MKKKNYAKSAHIYGLVVYKLLPVKRIAVVAGKLIHRVFLDKPLKSELVAQVTLPGEVQIDQKPNNTVIKMSRKEHVDAFFEDGTIRLGTFKYFTSYDHAEIGDKYEGKFILVGQDIKRNNSYFAELRGGFQYYVFCTYVGNPNKEQLSSFGYDACFKIEDIDQFQLAIARKLKTKEYHYAICVYKKDKVVVSDVPDGFEPERLGANYLEMVGIQKYFIKPAKYIEQKEFRFVWGVDSDVEDPIIVKCPEAVGFCKRIM